jgi:AcrR family transcriptional regulator
MLAEMPVAAVSLNELSRRVGLAKSNVLRYFESGEAILLDLLDAEMRDWANELDQVLTPRSGTARERVAFVSADVTRSVAARPVMCNLVSAQAAVLERDISTDVALRHKRSIAVIVEVLLGAIARVVPELTPQHAYQVIAHTVLRTSAAWPQTQPSEALLAAYAADPAVAGTLLDFTEVIRDVVELSMSGLLARQEATEHNASATRFPMTHHQKVRGSARGSSEELPTLHGYEEGCLLVHSAVAVPLGPLVDGEARAVGRGASPLWFSPGRAVLLRPGEGVSQLLVSVVKSGSRLL